MCVSPHCLDDASEDKGGSGQAERECTELKGSTPPILKCRYLRCLHAMGTCSKASFRSIEVHQAPSGRDRITECAVSMQKCGEDR